MRKSDKSTAGSSRLDAASWTEAALELLGTEGIKGVKVEVLAKRLGVTKGSFYSHFKDRQALYDQMLEQWRREATLTLFERLYKLEKDPVTRFRRLTQVPLKNRRGAEVTNVEMAIRLWAVTDPIAERVMKEVDALRLRYLEELMRECGVPENEVAARALLVHSYMRVAVSILEKDAAELMKTCENLLLGSGAAA